MEGVYIFDNAEDFLQVMEGLQAKYNEKVEEQEEKLNRS